MPINKNNFYENCSFNGVQYNSSMKDYKLQQQFTCSSSQVSGKLTLLDNDGVPFNKFCKKCCYILTEPSVILDQDIKHILTQFGYKAQLKQNQNIPK
ncbi:unnamed protein product [Paramecium pentaurelia]|uniref:Uncharacterized protein n=1 Tax=Paramecium pentaurelia TaxID=43138 RepID=A0A8S1VXN2_9CILI|nr:unnamed protein product [Paramecium pentaurelia]